MAKSIMEKKGTRECWNCGCYASAGYLHEHHIFGGPNRKLSEHYGLKVHLCYICHEDNKQGVHGQNHELQNRLHEAGQQAFEEVHGTREDFMRIFGKNYL